MSEPATESNAALPVAGWYPDPEHDTKDRWWDGANWSDHRRPRESASAAPAVPVATAYVPAGTDNPYGAVSSPYGTSVAPSGVVPYGAAPQAYPAYGTYGYAPPAPQNTAALVGFILALVGFGVGFFTYGLLALAGGIVSVVGLVKARKMRAEGLPNHRHGMALTGVIVGFGSLVLTILIFVAYFVFVFSMMSTYSSYDLSGY
jgi:hypothetical protein